MTYEELVFNNNIYYDNRLGCKLNSTFRNERFSGLTTLLHYIFFYIKKKIIKWFTHGWKAFGFENACVNQLANKYYFNKVNILYLRDITEVERSTKLCPFCSESLSTFKTTLKTQLSKEHSYTYTYTHVYNVLINCDLIIFVVGEGKTKKKSFLSTLQALPLALHGSTHVQLDSQLD